MRKTKSKLFKHDNHITDAIEFLRQNEPEEGYFLAFSGGKDSIVCYDLAVKSGVKFKAYYSCTRLDPPEIYKFIKTYYPTIEWLFPEQSFYKLLYKKGYPTRKARWCCDSLKKFPADKIDLKHRIVGLRAEESHKRAGRPKTEIIKSITKYKPIFNWLEWMVWDYIEENNLPYPSLYDEGFDRIGCVICPFFCNHNPGILNKHKVRWPKLYKVFEKVMTKHFEENLKYKKQYSHLKTAREFIDLWYSGYKITKKDNIITKRKLNED